MIQKVSRQTNPQREGGHCRRQSQEPIIELAQQFDVHPTQVTQWKQLLDSAAGVPEGEPKPASPTPAAHVKTLHANIGLTLKNNPASSARSGF
ncbi:MAG: hypothetical protein EOP23_12520 [Hyphomicrobiales bacterium]|nr:MAG: hypothetical protein EOP23_12520 [Hyphomicrobiales bacterium]